MASLAIHIPKNAIAREDLEALVEQARRAQEAAVEQAEENGETFTGEGLLILKDHGVGKKRFGVGPRRKLDSDFYLIRADHPAAQGVIEAGLREAGISYEEIF